MSPEGEEEKKNQIIFWAINLLVVYKEYNSAGIKFILIGNNDSAWDKYLRTEVSLGNNLRKAQ